MFRESLQKMVERVDGGVAGIMMGFDGISVESFTRPDERTDIQTVGMELAHALTQVRKASDLLEVGSLREVTMSTDRLVFIAQALNEEYFLAFALRPEGNFGKARYVMRLLVPKIQAEL